MQQQNQLWLEDLALRVTCVLALDRFGDFVSDEVLFSRFCIESLDFQNKLKVAHFDRLIQLLFPGCGTSKRNLLPNPWCHPSSHEW